MVYHCTADDESIAKMHTRHCSERVHVVSAHPNGGRIVVADRIKEAIFGREKPGRHAGVESEC